MDVLNGNLLGDHPLNSEYTQVYPTKGRPVYIRRLKGCSHGRPTEHIVYGVQVRSNGDADFVSRFD